MAGIQIITLEDARRAFREEAAILSKALNKKQGPNSPSDISCLSSSDVQRELGVSKTTLARWRQDGTIPFKKIRGKLLYTRSGIDALLERNTVVSERAIQ